MRDADMCAAMLLFEQIELAATLSPFVGNDTCTGVSGSFVSAGRFGGRPTSAASQSFRQLASQPVRISWVSASGSWPANANNPGTRVANPRADLQTGHRERTGIRYNNSFGGDSEKPQSGAPRRRTWMIMDVMEIQKYLPHRYPFLMVDGILEIERLKRIVGIKNVSVNEIVIFRAIFRAGQ